MDFSPQKYYICEEASIRGATGKEPSGNIDIISCEPESPTGSMNVVAFQYRPTLSSLSMNSNILSTSVKTDNTYEDPGSDRQVVVELLSLSQVLCSIDKDTKVVIMLKATGSNYQPYVYFPKQDMLLRVVKDIPFEVDMAMGKIEKIQNAMIGSFVFFLLVHYAVHPVFAEEVSEDVSSIECGWKKAVDQSLIGYVPHLSLQKLNTLQEITRGGISNWSYKEM